MMMLLKMKGMGNEEAMSFTPHSFRHWLPTMARQLELSKEQVCKIGHWDPTSGMPVTYGSVGTAAELRIKAYLFSQWHNGWRPSIEG